MLWFTPTTCFVLEFGIRSLSELTGPGYAHLNQFALAQLKSRIRVLLSRLNATKVKFQASAGKPTKKVFELQHKFHVHHTNTANIYNADSNIGGKPTFTNRPSRRHGRGCHLRRPKRQSYLLSLETTPRTKKERAAKLQRSTYLVDRRE